VLKDTNRSSFDKLVRFFSTSFASPCSVTYSLEEKDFPVLILSPKKLHPKSKLKPLHRMRKFSTIRLRNTNQLSNLPGGGGRAWI